MPGAGVEPARSISPKDFKSFVSTNFTIRAKNKREINLPSCQSGEPDSNRRPSPWQGDVLAN